jgi:hypothetical protein
MFTFTDQERAYQTEMRGIGTDSQGREVLVGLTFEETDFYMHHVRAFAAGHRDREARQRYLDLHHKHELLRLAIPPR